MKKKKLFSSFEQGLTLTSFMEDMYGGVAVPTVPLAGAMDESCGNDSGEPQGDYQLLGQKLLTLAKSLAPKHRSYTPLATRIAKLSFEENCYLDGIFSTLSKVVKKELRSLGETVMDSEIVKQLQELTPSYKWFFGTYEEIFSPEVSKQGGPNSRLLGRYDCGGSGVPYWHLCKKKRHDPNERTLYLYCPEVFPGFVLCGMQMGTSKYKNASFRSSSHVKPVELSYAISYLILLQTVQDNLLREEFRETVAYHRIVSFTGHQFNYGRKYLPRYQLEELEEKGALKAPSRLEGRNICLVYDYTLKGEEQEKLVDSVLLWLSGKGNHVEVLDEYKPFVFRQHPLWNLLAEILPEKEMSVLNIKCCSDAGYKGYQFLEHYEKVVRSIPVMQEPVFIYLSRIPAYLVWYSQFDDFGKEELDLLMKLVISFSTLSLATSHGDRLALPSLNCSCGYTKGMSIFMELFLAAHQVAEKEVRIIEEEKEDSKNHARSFETKMNIPKKILKIMEESTLNKRFGYIEYDEMCDENNIAVVNAQILQFVDTYFPKEDLKSVSLRFRRLGNHNAYGLYYPFYRCIAVELSHPASFVHEFGHMLDYSHGMLSNCLKSNEFTAVYKRYVKLLDEKLSKDEAMMTKYRLGGKKSKYNYYTKETEVFARSFEMYIGDTLKLENTIVRSAEDFAEDTFAYHPGDELYMELVREFFEGLPCMADLVAKAGDGVKLNIA